MYIRFLFGLFFLFFTTILYGQNVDPDELAEAQKKLTEAQTLYSKEHIEYAKAAINLALLYYKDENADSDEGDSLVLPALKIIRKEKGTTDSSYHHALALLPPARSALLDAYLDLQEALVQEGKYSPLYAQKLLKSAAVYLSLEDFEGHFLTVQAFQILAKLSTESAKPVYDYAKQHIDPIIIRLAKSQVHLQQLLKTEPQSIATADALVHFAGLSIQYNDYRTAYTETDTSYFYIQTALAIYKEKLGKTHKKYKKAFATFTKKMQLFYPIEKDMLNRIKQHATANDQFIIDLRPFLKGVDTTTFIFYGIESVFEWVRTDLKRHHGGSNSKYYAIIQAMEETWDLTELESKIAIQKSIAKQVQTEFGKISEPYVKALINLANLYVKDSDYINAFKPYSKAFQILDEIELNLPFDANSEETLFQKYIRTIAPPWNTFITNEHNLSIQSAIYGEQSNEYLTTLFQTAWDYLKNDDLRSKGDPYFKKGMKGLSEKNFFIATNWVDSLLRRDPEYNLPIVAEVLPKVFPLVNLKQALQFTLDSLTNEYGNYSVEYGNALEVLADGYFYAQNTPKSADEALRLYRKILTIYKSKEGVEYSYLRLLKRLVKNIEQANPWSIDESNYFFEELGKTLQYQKIDDLAYATYLGRYANWHYKGERIIAAEPHYQQLINIYKNKSEQEQTNVTYVQALYNLARIYRKTGRYTTAVNAYYVALAASKASNNWTLIIRCFDDLGLIAHKKNKIDFALQLFGNALKVLELVEKFLPEKDRYHDFQTALQYTKIMRHIGRLYLDEGAIEMAESYYDKIKAFERDENSPVSFKRDISLRSDLAHLAELKGDTLKAIRYYRAAIRQLKDKGELADVNIAFANFYSKNEQDSMAAIYFTDALKIDLEQIEQNYTNLSEKERLLFLAPIAKRINLFFNFVVEHPDSNLILTAFNAHLMVKGLALETSTNLQSVCMATENIAIQNKCHQMQALRKQLAKSTALPLDVQDEINAQIVSLEKEIGISSKDLRAFFGKNNKKLDFSQLQKILYAMETDDSLAIAIDFLVLNEIDENEEEQAIYYAAIVNSHTNLPQFVRLATEEELEDVLAPDIAPNTINYITDELESRYLYELVWEPILPYIDSSKRLHICPTGILSKIAFGTLRSNDYTQRRIMDDWSIHYYSSFRDLLTPQIHETVKESANIGLIGGVEFTFTKQETERLAESIGIPSIEVEEALDQKAQPTAYSRGSRGEDFNYLPGTLKEVKAISQLFPSGWVVQLLSDTLATEENLTIMTDNSPTILHIATHGYFFPTPPKEDHENDQWLSNSKKTQSLEDKIANLSNPLLRSGLALGGINRVWKGGEEIEGLEDGILTALEVANMDLFRTQLVVLSACETGRGDIDNNEGIMGLRRAFKTAGAKQLIISLWKVPDQQTSELMQLFYKGYINGKTAHKAFEQAQHIMRKRYRNPYYWAAFLLIE